MVYLHTHCNTMHGAYNVKVHINMCIYMVGYVQCDRHICTLSIHEVWSSQSDGRHERVFETVTPYTLVHLQESFRKKKKLAASSFKVKDNSCGCQHFGGHSLTLRKERIRFYPGQDQITHPIRLWAVLPTRPLWTCVYQCNTTNLSLWH